MLPQDIIARKRDGEEIGKKDLRGLALGFAGGEVPDYQMSAFAMAVCLQGMSFGETCALTEAMVESGETLDFSGSARFFADKHSTGGIGDKVSLVLAPLAASCGLAVPMISGRGLGLTGGTLDKLESIPGFRVNLSASELGNVVNQCGCAITGQTEEIAPADKKLYALRDVTATVPSIPLVSASILSKKLAAGLEGLVLDVKCGSGAFMKTEPDARELAETMVAVGSRMGCRVEAQITEMSRPLGRTAGNAPEVVEAVQALHGQGPDDLIELTLSLVSNMLAMSGRGDEEKERRDLLLDAISSGRAWDSFIRMVELQGGDPAAFDDIDGFGAAKFTEEIASPKAGFVSLVDSEKVGRAAFALGAGRRDREDSVDHSAGVSELKQAGEFVELGGTLAKIHASSSEGLGEARDLLLSAFEFSEESVEVSPLILARINAEDIAVG